MAATLTGHAFGLHLDVDAIADGELAAQVRRFRRAADRRIASRMPGTDRVRFVSMVNREYAQQVGELLAWRMDTEPRDLGDDGECDACESTGRIIVSATDSSGEEYDAGAPCPTCSPATFARHGSPQARACRAVEAEGGTPNQVLVKEAEAVAALVQSELELWRAIRALEDAGTTDLTLLTTAVGLLHYVAQDVRGELQR